MPHLKASTAPSPGMAMEYHRRRRDDHRHCSSSSSLSQSQFPQDDGLAALGAAVDHNSSNNNNDDVDNDLPIQEATKGYLGTSDSAVMALARNTQNSHKIESFDSVSSSASSSSAPDMKTARKQERHQRSQSMTTTEHYGYHSAASPPAQNNSNNNKTSNGQSMVTPSPAGGGKTKRSSSTSSMKGSSKSSSSSTTSTNNNGGPILTIFGSSRWTTSPIRVRRRVSAEEDEMDHEDDDDDDDDEKDKNDRPSQDASVPMPPPTNLRYVPSSHDHHYHSYSQRVGFNSSSSSPSPNPAVWSRRHGNALVGDKRPAAQDGGKAPLKKNKIKDQEDKSAKTTDIGYAPVRSKKVLEVKQETKEEHVEGNQKEVMMDLPPPTEAKDDDDNDHHHQRASPPMPYHPYPPPPHQHAPYGGGGYPGMYTGYRHQHYQQHDHHAHYVHHHHHAPPRPPPGHQGAYQHGHGAPIPPPPPPHQIHRQHPHYHPYHYRGPPPPPHGGPHDRAAAAAAAGQPPSYPGPFYPGTVGNDGLTSINGAVRGSPTTYCKHPSTSANRCVPLKAPIPSKASTGWGDVDMAHQEVVLPDFHRLVNYPDYLTKGSRPSLLSNDFTTGNTISSSVSCGSTTVSTDGRKNCVMCGKLRVCSATSLVQNHKGRTKTDTSSSSISSSSSSDASVGEKEDGTAHIIPRQNKGLCTACDVSVWVVTATGLEIKWCKGCKNFRPWAAFGDKGIATKCVRCRERQREKYALQNKMRSSQRAKQGNGSGNAPPSSTSTLPAVIKQEDHDLAAARGLQNLFQAVANTRV